MPMKYRLVTPGPAMAPEATLLELAKPIRHHRTAENKALIQEAVSSLQKVFATTNDVVILTSSGTGAMEASISNFLKQGEVAIVVVAGKWGERWAELVETFGGKLVPLKVPYGRVVAPDQVKRALQQHPQARIVCATLSETSTGVAHDIEAIGSIVHESEALFAVDGISGVGAMECRTDDWHIDLLAVGSQKALMMPPGLAFLSVSEKAKKVLEERGAAVPAYYFNLAKALKAGKEFDTPFTPAHTLIAALVQSLRLILSDGMETVWRNAQTLSKAMLAGVHALGLEPFAERPTAGLTTIKVPEGIDGPAWEKKLEKTYGLKVAGGQGSMKGKIIRIAHMGYIDALDLVGITAALEWSLLELGHEIEPGKATGIVTRIIAEDYVPVAAKSR